MATQISISREGAQTLREFAQAMPYAVENLSQDTETLRRVFESVSEGLGEIEPDFADIVDLCSQAVANAQESIEGLPADLERTATAIDDYLNDHPEIDAGGAVGGGDGTDGAPHIGARVYDTKVHTRR